MNKSFEILKFVRANIAAMKPYSSARDEYQQTDEKKIFIDANENPFSSDYNRYPDPQQRLLKSKIADLKGVKTNQILLGNGSDEVLDLLFRAFCEPNIDAVITNLPSYGMYDVLANLNAIENKKLLLTPDFELDVEQILAHQTATTKLLFICTPNNPSGNVFSISDVERLLNKFQGLVVIDEAYIDFSSYTTWLEKLNRFDNLVVIQTFSKAYGMAGVRIGMCFASSGIIEILHKIKPPYNVNTLSQRAVLNRLTEKSNLATEIETIRATKDELIQHLETIPFVEEVFASETNFVLVRVDDANKRYLQLLEAGIVVRNRNKEQLCENCLRVTIGTPIENQKLIETLKTI